MSPPLPELLDDVLALEVDDPPEAAVVEEEPVEEEPVEEEPVEEEPVGPAVDAPPAPPCADVSSDPHADGAAAPTTTDKKMREMVFITSSFPGCAETELQVAWRSIDGPRKFARSR
jgi:hypothetical protein